MICHDFLTYYIVLPLFEALNFVTFLQKLQLAMSAVAKRGWSSTFYNPVLAAFIIVTVTSLVRHLHVNISTPSTYQIIIKMNKLKHELCTKILLK